MRYRKAELNTVVVISVPLNTHPLNFQETFADKFYGTQSSATQGAEQ